MSSYNEFNGGDIVEPRKKSRRGLIIAVAAAIGLIVVVVCATVVYPLYFTHPDFFDEAVVKGSKPDTASWNALLNEYVSDGDMEGINLSVVDYQGLAQDARFNSYIKSLATTDTSAMTRDEFYVTYMNAYNAFAMNMVIQHPCKKIFGFCTGPIKSITDVNLIPFLPVWKTRAGVIGGTEISLDDIESALRDPTKVLTTDNKEDPRLHACIVCASISCPNIRAEAFQLDIVDAQMDDQMRNMLNNTMKGFALDTTAKKVTLSKIFFWYGKDFTTVFATDSIITALQQWFPKEAQDFIAGQKLEDISVDYFDYNWSANGDVTKLV